jgi:hypothetical protein
MKAITEILLLRIYGIIETEIENYEKLNLPIDNESQTFLR